jgi:hypothetical protein
MSTNCLLTLIMMFTVAVKGSDGDIDWVNHYYSEGLFEEDVKKTVELLGLDVKPTVEENREILAKTFSDLSASFDKKSALQDSDIKADLENYGDLLNLSVKLLTIYRNDPARKSQAYQGTFKLMKVLKEKRDRLNNRIDNAAFNTDFVNLKHAVQTANETIDKNGDLFGAEMLKLKEIVKPMRLSTNLAKKNAEKTEEKTVATEKGDEDNDCAVRKRVVRNGLFASGLLCVGVGLALWLTKFAIIGGYSLIGVGVLLSIIATAIAVIG